MTDVLKKKKKTRGGHKSYLKKILSDARQCLEEYDEQKRLRAAQLKTTLEEELHILKKLDDEIVDMLTDNDDIDEEVIYNEIEEAGCLRAEIQTAIMSLEQYLKPIENPIPVVNVQAAQPKESAKTTTPEDDLEGASMSYMPVIENAVETATPQVKETSTNSTPSSVENAETSTSFATESAKTTTPERVIRAKLPKLEIKRYNGRPNEWQEFWDGFESSIHSNASLSNVDKFSYLRGLIQGPAHAAIAGFALTSANYEAAIALLKRRFGKRTNIQRSHINEMLKVEPVVDDKDTRGLRKLHDAIEAHHRGLQAIGVESSAYDAIVVPAIVEKMPEAVRLTVTRGKDHAEWSMDEMLAELLAELELREEYSGGSRREWKRTPRDDGRKKGYETPSTGSALHAGAEMEQSCAYCREAHNHKDCSKVKSVNNRKQLLRKYGRCFICIKKGHIARNCNSKVICSSCKGRHHISICESDATNYVKDEVTSNNNDLNARYIKPTFHVGSVVGVALQTAQAIVHGKKRLKVRVLFDTGSHRSFITSRAVRLSGVEKSRKEWIEISTFGQQGKAGGLKAVHKLELLPVGGGDAVQIEVYEVPNISQIRNEHVELCKTEYAHLHGLWFSDVCKGEEVLEVDVLIGADYLWCFQGGRTIRGERDEPVAVETCLGWVLSGPMKGRSVRKETNVNFVSHEMSSEGSIEQSIQKLWDYETLGIREELGVHEALKDSIAFNGTRYKVCLPWKEGNKPLPSNYGCSAKRLKGQLEKLRKDPNVLHEYDSIIKEQGDLGIIEKVAELESSEKVHYLPHHAVVRKDAKTTKVRVVYDASCKDSKKGVSLNDCLHVGPALSPLLFDILVRFREKRVAVVGDIEKAFLNIEVAEKDRDCLRFLLVDDVSKEQINPVVYRFCRVVFGVNCSPFLLNATLRFHLDRFNDIDPEFVRVMKDSFYVDDLVTGKETVGQAHELFVKA